MAPAFIAALRFDGFVGVVYVRRRTGLITADVRSSMDVDANVILLWHDYASFYYP